MAASNICHSWSPFADNSASFWRPARSLKLARYLLVAHITATNTPRGHEKGELVYEKPFNAMLGAIYIEL